MARYVNKAELAELLQISERSLTEWQKEGMPIHQAAEVRGQENSYDVAAVVRWWIQRDLAKAQVRSPRDRLDEVRAERESLLLRKDRDELVARADIRPLLDRFVHDTVAVIDSMPDKYAPLMQETPDLEAKHQLLKEAARQIREALGNYEFCCEAPAGGNTGV